MNTCEIIFYRDHPDAVKPQYAYGTSAAFDVTCTEDTLIKGRESAVVPNGLKLSIPETSKYYMTIALRSSLGFKKNLVVHPGIIDPGYTGSLGVKIFNFSDEDVLIRKGERYAQILVHERIQAEFKELSLQDFMDYEKTQIRKSGGFGSSGKN